MDMTNLKPHARKASTLLKALANERRLLILCHLAEGERSVGELEDIIGLSQSALSQHLARLRRDRLVKTRRNAQTIFYTVSSAEVFALLIRLRDLYDVRLPKAIALPPELMRANGASTCSPCAPCGAAND